MKRYLSLAFAAIICISFITGCGGDSPSTPSSGGDDVTFSLSPTSLSFDATASSQTITVTCASKPGVTSSESWCTREIGSVADNKCTVKVSVAANTGSERTASLTFTYNGSTAAIVEVKQAAASGSSSSSSSGDAEVVVTDINVASSLTNSNATSKAKSLYSALKKIYGQKVVSGAMGGTAWENTFTDFIKSQSGYYPGIVGYDYIFLNWPAKAWSDCPDYSDITPVKTAYDAGNIIQICWHWTVPTSESGFVNVEEDGFTLTSDKTTALNAYKFDTKAFSVKKALTSGTWENKVITYQIKRLAGFLKLLQDADIPILFRPLHEAAGDYTWGAWFWWGYEGADQCIALWKYLRDQLENTYGINNLIWVWTVQSSNGGNLASVSQMKEWYPGDEYVDIIGADLYVDKNTTQENVFQQVNSSADGHKMVALSECGNLLDFSGAFKAGATWLYFMNWCESTSSLSSSSWNNTASDWKNIQKSSYCINQGGLSY